MLISEIQAAQRMLQAIRHNEFVVHYQPVIDSATTRVRSVEALVRWQDPARGLVPPGRFIPIAEATGVIVPLGAFVLRTACAQFQAWRTGLNGSCPEYVAVNVAYQQCIDPTFVPTVEQILRETGLPPEALELELTEGRAFSEDARAMQTIHALSQIGIRFSMDDFGTGFNVLTQFTKLHKVVSTLKIDRSFVLGLPAREHIVIIKTVHAIAKIAELDVISEGIEDPAQLATLLNEGHQGLQGYLFARPAAAEDLRLDRAYPIGSAVSL